MARVDLHHLGDVPDESSTLVRLRHEVAAIRDLVRMRMGIAGGNPQRNVRPAPVDLLRERPAVHEPGWSRP